MITYQGKTQSAEKWSEETGLHRHTIRQRQWLGWTPEEILTTQPQQHQKRQIKYKGKTQSLYAWSQQLGIHSMTILRRHKAGQPLDAPLPGGRQLIIDGKTIREWAAKLGINHNTAYSRHKRLGTFARQSKKYDAVKHKGKTQSLTEWSHELGIGYNTLLYRYKKGQPLN